MKIINVMAASLNGRIAASKLEGDKERQQIGLSSPADRKFLMRQIHGCDAIIVGATSIRANGGCIDEPGKDGVPPTWYVVTERGLSESLEFWQQTHIPRVIVSPKKQSNLPEGVENLVTEEHALAKKVYKHLESKRFKSVLLFGGGVVNKFFYDANLVDELKLTLSPLFIAGKDTPFLISPELASHVRFRLVSSQLEESFVFLEYEVIKSGHDFPNP